jgi:hypothetical protein
MMVAGVLLVLVAVAGALVWSMLPTPASHAVDVDAKAEPRPRANLRAAVLRLPASLWADVTGSLRTPAGRIPRPRRRVRFEDTLEMTVPDDPALLSSSHASRSFVYAPDPAPEHIPLYIRIFGAVRLVVLIALSAAAVAFVIWAAGYLINEHFLKMIGPDG